MWRLSSSRIAQRSALCAGALTVMSCSLPDLVAVDSKSGIIPPEAVMTETGARQLYNSAGLDLARAMIGGNDVTFTVFGAIGLHTDELMLGTNNRVGVDERTGFTLTGTESYRPAYRAVQQARVQASQARQALSEFGANLPTAWQSHMASAEGFAILWFAEAFCSGVPLSFVPLKGAPIDGSGKTTTELFEAAAALFDTALTLAGDSTRLAHLARVGKARALLGLGRLNDAASAVASVPTSFVFNASFNSSVSLRNQFGNNPTGVQVSDGEGGNGLSFATDPRTATMTATSSGALRVSGKYSVSGATLNPSASFPNTPARLADGLEARLIEAEANLAGDRTTWLATLNTLRSTCVGTAACAPIPTLTASSLPPLSDPGTAAARLDLLMRERAMWLYMTGHRQGDLRRLVRVYQRDPATLWPTGIYTNPGSPPQVAARASHGIAYGNHYVFAVQGEVGNPNYTGCVNLDP